MKSEIHLMNLIKTSSYVRELVSKLLGSAIKPWEAEQYIDLLLRLPLKETLRSLTARLECNEDEVFTKIVTRASVPMAGSYGFKLTIEDLRELDSIETHSRLASILDCDPWDVLDELLDVQPMLKALFEFAPTMVRQLLRSRIKDDQPFPSASETVRSVLLVHRRLEDHFGINENQWGEFIDERNWLRNNALYKLLRFCGERGIVQTSGAGLLAATLHESTTFDNDDEIRLDALAVIHLEQRLNWIVRQLHEQAEELAQRVEASAAAPSRLSRLECHLEFYELKSPASAWRRIIDKETKSNSLGDRFPQVDFRSTGVSGTPKKSSSLKVRTEQIQEELPFWRFWRKGKIVGSALIVSCEIEEGESAVDILICNNISPAQIASVEQFFSSLPAVAVAQRWVSDIGNQLLLEPLTFSESFRDVLVNACAKFSRELIQGLILAGVRLHSGIESELPKPLGCELWIKPAEVYNDIFHPLSRAEVVQLTENDYVDCNVVIIR